MQDTIQKIKAKTNEFLKNPHVRFALVLTGTCISAYAGGRSTMANVERNTRNIEKNTSLTNEFIVAEANLREARAAEDRSIIGELTEAGEPFVFYPGLGVLDLNQFNKATAKPKKAS